VTCEKADHRPGRIEMWTGRPLILISPEAPFDAPAGFLIGVDLPAPLRPSSPKSAPGKTVDGHSVASAHAAEGYADVAQLDQRNAAGCGSAHGGLQMLP
jgi:hypothetical protein